MTQGFFITLEGGEGVGKSTQAARLADALRARAIDVVVTREPGGTPGAEAIRDLLMTGSEDRWSARAEALLFAAARADHVEKIIRPALERGNWVLCDRFVDSTRAYQGGAGGVSDEEIIALHNIGCRGLMPDRTFLFQLAFDEAHWRVQSRNEGEDDRIGARGATYHQKLAARFCALAAQEPARLKVIDASGDATTVTLRLLDALSDIL